MQHIINDKSKEVFLILLGAFLYSIGTVFFIFPHSILLGGTSGISVIISNIGTLSPGNVLNIINTLLLVIALIVLGKSMAFKTLLGSVFTAVFIALLEPIEIKLSFPPLISAIIGAIIIAIAGGLLFYINSSSGGTDIIALIIKRFSSLSIGKALLFTDFLIVIVGAIISGWEVAICSFVGLLVKTLGTDFVIDKLLVHFSSRNK